jgi:cell division septal protein FtsQ
MPRDRVTKITIAVLIFLAIFFVLGYIWKVLARTDYFKIKEIVYRTIDDAKEVVLSDLIGKNIFSIDLRKESNSILNSFSQYYKIRLVRVLPDRLFVEFLRRKPLALLNQCRKFALDENGILFYFPGQPDELELPLILGLENKISHPKPGQRYNFKELTLVLDIIKAAQANKIIKNFKLKRVDVTNPASTSVNFLQQEDLMLPILFTVKLGQGNIEDKLNILADLIVQGKNELGKIEYFDLRFKEPVVKLKDTVKK